MSEIATIIDDDRLAITLESSHSDVLVVSYTGVGLELGIQKPEFGKSLAGLSGNTMPAVAYVTDRHRSWFNGGILERIVVALNDIIGRGAFGRVVTIGNSMGGFGAIITASKLNNCRQCLAFCPQSSVHPRIVPFENRWTEWRDRISEWDVPDATTELSQQVRYDLYFGLGSGTDQKHANRYLSVDCENLSIHNIKGCGHQVAAHLKRQGLLQGIIHNTLHAGAQLHCSTPE